MVTSGTKGTMMTGTMTDKGFLEQLREAMSRADITQAELARRMGKSESSISQFLHPTRNLTLRSMLALSEAVGCSVEFRLVPPTDPDVLKSTPYLTQTETYPAYNPAYGDERECKCGHPYYRHFDSYDDNCPVGCKYCECSTFEEMCDGPK